MNAPDPSLLPELRLGHRSTVQRSLELASEGVQRFVWNSAFGPILIEVKDGAAYVNGQRVTPFEEPRAGV